MLTFKIQVLSTQSTLALNPESSCLHLPGAVIVDMDHHTHPPFLWVSLSAFLCSEPGINPHGQLPSAHCNG